MPDTEQATRYREVRRLGAGGMATVTLAEATVLGQPVALETASVQTDRTEQCSGTAQTVRIRAGGWVVDGVAINCS
jgi:serine/threonine protein kinase